MIENSLVTYLNAQIPGIRLYPLTVPENVTLPAIAYERISTPRTYGIGGPMGFAQPRFQFSAYGNNQPDTIAAIEALRAALDGFSGTMGDTTVREISCEGERDSYDPTSKSFHRSIDFYIAHEE